MNNLPKVVTQQSRGRASNPRLLDRKSDALPLSHRATPITDQLKQVLIGWCAQLSQDTLNRAIEQLPKTLMMVIKTKGGHSRQNSETYDVLHHYH